MCHAPNHERKAVKKQEIAQKEKRIGYLLNHVQHGQLGDRVRGDIEHAESVTRLTGGGIKIEMINQHVSNNGKRHKAKKDRSRHEYFADASAVSARDDQINAHYDKNGVPKHRVKRHRHEIGVEYCVGHGHDSKTADNAVKGEKTVADLTHLVPRNDGGEDRSCAGLRM